MLTESQKREFHENGFTILRGFYDPETELRPIQRAIYDIVGLMIRKYGLRIERPAFQPGSFDAGYQALIAHDRRIGGEVYDAVKQIPAFIRLVAGEKNEKLIQQIRDSGLVGIAAGGYGIRIDNPGEEQFRAPWHQEYPAQLRSMDGVVLWSSLVPVTKDIGPVEFCHGSHRRGPARVHGKDPDHPEKSGAYALILENEAQVVGSYAQSGPLTNPGDLVLIDFLTIHRSGFNRAARSRWSMQFRYFNFLEATGIRIGWKGSYAAGIDFRMVHPELIVD